MAAELKPLACHRAVQFATEIGLQEVISEGDAEVLIKMLQQNEFKFVPYGQIIEDINFSFSVWIEELPEDLYPFVLYDIQ
ncbi:hypothetical protein SO802_034404 [Lithocarpus litseifolius]|uniref:Uncharacterized protein n=1 Tax=Lithocarpus litseifolius TaxID=425828 RepID=A0AAW2BFU0_9ROSI